MSVQPLLTPKETCDFLNVKMCKFRCMVFRKELEVIRIGRLLRIDPVALKKWIHVKKLENRFSNDTGGSNGADGSERPKYPAANDSANAPIAYGDVSGQDLDRL